MKWEKYVYVDVCLFKVTLFVCVLNQVLFNQFAREEREMITFIARSMGILHSSRPCSSCGWLLCSQWTL